MSRAFASFVKVSKLLVCLGVCRDLQFQTRDTSHGHLIGSSCLCRGVLSRVVLCGNQELLVLHEKFDWVVV